jgi:protocatechuate 3,4-dioxygenase beta subunit
VARDVVVAPGSQPGSLVVSWKSAEAADGEPALTYSVTASPGDVSCSTPLTSCELVGLASGVELSITVVARGATGTSDPVTLVVPPGVVAAEEPDAAGEGGNASGTETQPSPGTSPEPTDPATGPTPTMTGDDIPTPDGEPSVPGAQDPAAPGVSPRSGVQPQSGTGTGSIAVTVTDVGAVPLPSGVVVYAYASEFSSVYCPSLDASNIYTCANLADGSYRISVSANGLVGGTAYRGEWYSDASSYQTATPVVITAGGPQAVSIQLAASAHLTVRVTGPNASATQVPVSTASVYAHTSEYEYTFCQQSAGAVFVCAGLEPGETYRVKVSNASGEGGLSYLPEWYDNKTSYDAASDLTAQIGGGDDVVVALAAAASVKVAVTGPNASGVVGPVTNASVSAYAGESSSSYCSQGWPQDGVYVCAGLVPGQSYRFQVSHYGGDGLSYLPQWYDNKTTYAQATAVVADLATTKQIAVELAPAGKIAMTVTGKNAAGTAVPLSGLSVSAYDLDGQYVTNCWNGGSGGVYTCTGLAPGSYRVSVSSYGLIDGQSYLSEWFDNATTSATATAIPVTSGATAARSMELAKAGALSVRVQGKDASGTLIGLSNIGVQLRSDTGSYGSCSSTPTAGDYVCTGLTAGSYVLQAYGYGSVGGITYLGRFYPNTRNEEEATPIAITTGSNPAVTLTLPRAAKVSGTVTGPDATGAPVPIPDAEVYLDSVASGNDAWCDETDASGKYTCTYVEAGSYQVVAETWGSINGVSYAKGSSTLGAVAEGSVISGGAADVLLPRATAVVGRVVDAAGVPVPSGSVRLESDTYDDYADIEDGQYAFSRVPVGSYTVSFQARGYLPNFYSNTTSKAAATPVSVTAATTTTLLDQTMRPAPSISGVVTGPGGTPLRYVDVRAVDSAGDAAGWASTNASGQYTVHVEASGEYRLRFNPRSDSGALPEWFDDKATADKATTIPVVIDLNGDGQPVAGKDVQLAAAGEIAGTVTSDETSVGLAYVDVSAYDAETGDHAGWARTDADGKYRILGLPQGEYLVQFDPTSFSGGDAVGFVGEWNSDKPNKSRANPVAVAAGTATTVDAGLARGAVISGLVTTPTGAPVPYAQVSVFDALTRSYARQQVQADNVGRYTVPGLPTGKYRVFAHGSGQYVGAWSGGASRDQATVFSVVLPAPGTTADITLGVGATLTGVVTDSATKAPLSNARVSIWDDEIDLYRDVQTDPSGRYTIPGLPAGTFTVGVSSTGRVAVERQVVLTSTGVTTADFALVKMAQVTGRITVPGASGEWEVRVEACSSASQCRYVGYVYGSGDQARSFTLSTDPGVTRIRFRHAWGPNVVETQWYNAKASFDQAAAVTLSAGVKTALGDITLQLATRSISGSVTDNAAAGVANVRVEAWAADSCGTYECDERVTTAYTGATGAYTLAGLAPGSYKLFLRQDDGVLLDRWIGGDGIFPGGATPIVVAGSNVNGVNAVLNPAAQISGRVTNSAGEPLAYTRIQAHREGTDPNAWFGVARGYTNDDGKYVVLGLQPGSYRLYFDGRDAPGGVESAWLGNTAQKSLSPVVGLPVAGSSVSGKDIALRPGGSIAGVVTGAPHGLPLARIPVELYAADKSVVAYDETGPDGSYRFSRLPVESYRVRVVPSNAGTYSALRVAAFGTSTGILPTPTWTDQWFASGGTFDQASAIVLTEADRKSLDRDVALTSASVPGAPTAVKGVPGNARATVSWAAPASSGGAAITKYTVISSPSGKTCTTTGALSCSVTGLVNGTSYTFKVTATSVAGTGAASAASAAVVPRTVPGAPTSVKGAPGNARATVSWVAPASSGGAAITKYTVTSSPSGKTCTTTGARTCTVLGLVNGTSYTFRVTATNVAGTGAASPASAAVVPRTVPGAPRSVVASPGVAQARVSWVAAASTGGAVITKYTVTSSPGGKTCTTTGAGRSCAVSGLTNGTVYTFKVTAANAAGTGAASAPSAGIVPGPPAIVKVKAVSKKGKLAVDVDPNKGSDSWAFRVQVKQANGTWRTSPTPYATGGTKEKKTINLPKGTYRVVVDPKFGYRVTTSAAVTLVK